MKRNVTRTWMTLVAWVSVAAHAQTQLRFTAAEVPALDWPGQQRVIQ